MDKINALVTRLEKAAALVVTAEKKAAITLETCTDLCKKVLIFTGFLQDILEARLSTEDATVAAAIDDVTDFCAIIETNLDGGAA